MRLVVLFISLVFASSVQAQDMSFKCVIDEDDTYTDLGDMHILVEGVMSGAGEKRELKYRGEFSLGCNEEWSGEPDDCWADTPEKYGNVSNQLPYNPRKYKDHRKFNLNMDSDNSFGSYDLIFPQEKLIEGKNKFDAFMILTNINDHFGTTAGLKCERTAKFKFPDGYVNTNDCMKTVMSMINTVNICGDDDSFVVWNCKQKKIGEDIQCRAMTATPGDGCVMDIVMGPMCQRNKATMVVRDERDK